MFRKSKRNMKSSTIAYIVGFTRSRIYIHQDSEEKRNPDKCIVIRSDYQRIDNM